MSLTPAFEIGLWNAWIFAIFFIVPSLVIPFISKELYKKLSNPPDMRLSVSEKAIGYIATIITYIAFLYAIFLPLKLGTAWFYTGLFIFLLAVAVLIIASINFINTPPGKPTTKGMYRYSRHPIYFSNSLALLGIGIAAASWIVLLVSITFIILANIVADYEELYCKKKYGSTYKEYLNRTPRWIGIPKS